MRLNSAEQEAQAFWWMRSRCLAAAFRQILERSRLRISLVVGLSLFFWLGLFLLFYEGFRFLETYLGISGQVHAQTVQAVYNVFFASLTVMLLFSAAIILYSGLYRSAETAFLLTTPASAERIVLYKFQESLLFSSWGFFLLGSPMLVAYGVVEHSPWYYYLMVVPLMVAFVYVPCSVGAMLCLLVVQCIPRIRVHATGLAVAGLALFTILTIWTLVNGVDGELLTPRWFQSTLSRLRFTERRLLPSWWLSSGLLEAARTGTGLSGDRPRVESMLFLALLVSNALVCHLAILWIGRKIFRSSYHGLHTAPAAKRRKRIALIDRLAMTLTRFLPYQVRLLMIKDLRVFRRDPVQWSQFLIFFGLLGLYFVNIRRFSYDVNFTGWINMISFLNLAVIGLILSTFTTRFIFPMISLEGSRFWILGLLPVDRNTILWGKFLFAAAGSLIPCTLLILISDLVLQVAPLVLVIHLTTCILLCAGLSGIAVGLGAMMPDLSESSPSKIAAGFGGTLNLVLSSIYIVAVVLLTALPCHFYLASQSAELGRPLLDESRMEFWLWLGTGGSVVLGVLATVVPLKMGLRAFRSMEF